MAKDCLMKQYTDLREEYDRREKVICKQKDKLASLDKEKTLSESRIRERSAVPGGVLQHQGKHRRDLKHINDLEHKLHLENIKFNKVMCRNTEYRKAIELLLQMKGSLCKSEEKSNRQLAQQKILSEKLGEELAYLFERRIQVETRVLELEEDIKEETAQFTKRRSALKTLIARNGQLQNFMKTKLREFPPLEKDEDSKKKKKKTNVSGDENLEMYRQGYSTLVEVTGETDLCQMGLAIAQKEQKKCPLTKYINELHNRKHTLRNRTEQLKSDILSLEEENRRHDDQIKSDLKRLQPELEEYGGQSEALEKQRAVVQRTLDQLEAAISGLLGDVMQEDVVVNPDDIVHYIGVLEERIVHLLLQANASEEKMRLFPQNMLLANFDLLPEEEVVMETARSRSASRSPKETR
ncbi:coiled-coil domain-containing protein 40-like [Pungitius pungitius]|uniref:coiled-coil domain-containing protein 40-like n=1 Tax=Pungitius pungitius TaxID=134920 RepID=UPI002E140851